MSLRIDIQIKGDVDIMRIAISVHVGAEWGSSARPRATTLTRHSSGMLKYQISKKMVTITTEAMQDRTNPRLDNTLLVNRLSNADTQRGGKNLPEVNIEDV